MFRILYLITGLAIGGAETQLFHLATRLKTWGWDIHVVSLMPPRAYTEELGAAGISISCLGIRRKLPDPRPLWQLVCLIRTWRPHVVHSHMVHANLLARLVRPLAPMPVFICTAHSIDEGGRLREILYRLTDPLCDLTTQVSQAGLERYVRVGAVPAHKICFVPNGVDTARFRPDLRARERLRSELELGDSFVWLAVGRFEQAKDYPNMLQAFARVAEQKPGAHLLIAGQGSLREEAEQLVGELKMVDRVHFLGVRRDIPALMNAVDGYVMSSAWEGTSMVLLEASATGLPIVATAVGGNCEVVIDGQSGFLVPPKDPSALMQAMLRLMDLPSEERVQMGQSGRAHVEAHYSLERVVDRWESLYAELLAGKGIK